MLLYYLTDRNAFAGSEGEKCAALLRRIAEAARAGVDYIQLREKDLDPADLELLAHEAVRLVRKNSEVTRVLINSQVEVALAVGADGVHLTAKSPPISEVRKSWLERTSAPPIIGCSAHGVAEVRLAETHGASFAVLAPIFEKVATGARGIGVEALQAACTASGMPVLALGGVRLGNARSCLEAGAAGIAGIRLFQEQSVGQTVEALHWLDQRILRFRG